MNLLELVDKINVDNPSRREIDTIVIMLRNLLEVIKLLAPNNKDVINRLGVSMEQELQKQRAQNATFEDYFSARGLVANKLRESLTVLSYITEDMNTVGSDNLKKHIETTLDMFRFNFSKDPEVMGGFQLFLNTVATKFRDGIYKTIKPALDIRNIEFNLLDGFGSGVYGNDSNTSNLTFVLRAKVYPEQNNPKKTHEVLYVLYPNQAPEVWVQHPFEKSWLNATFGLTPYFPGMKEALEIEMSHVFNEAGRFVEAFDFLHEMETLAELSSVVFDQEDVLPKLISVINGSPMVNVFNTNPGSGYYSNDGSVSSIVINYSNNLELTFINTKGEYPSREFGLMTKLHNFTTRVDYNKVDKTSQLYIVQVANQVLKTLWNEIEKSSQQ